VLHYSPMKGGLSYLPFGLTIGAGIGIGTALMPKVGVKPLLTFGFFACAVGLFLTSGIDPHSTYLSGVVPGMVVLGLGSGLCFPASGNASLHEVTGQDSSLASGVQASFQQVGGALGLSVLVTIGLRHAASLGRHGTAHALAITHGYVLSFRVGAILLVVGGILVLLLLEHVIATPRTPEAEVDTDPQPDQVAASVG
jgi:MFS family permease